MKKAGIFLLFVIVFFLGLYMFLKEKDSKIVYRSVEVDRGDINITVSASGTIEPINVVSVGTQVSGIIENVYVDYNSKVKKGDLLAELDRSVLIEEVNSATARFEKSKTALNYARINFERNKKLLKEDFIAKLDYEESEVSYAEAKANYETSASDLKKAEKNLGYSKITSPISGIIISKEVESGQTVAASYQTPTLFQVAEDLTKMQIEASISESDIGLIKENQTVKFTVDAYPNDVFIGSVAQIRLSPTTESNVVMYTVVVAFDNADGRLLPGMTAFVTIEIDSHKEVLRVPNMVFQYRPYPIKEKLALNETYIYILKDGKETKVLLKKGVSDSSYSEAISGVLKGDKVIYEVIGGEKKTKGRK